MTANHAKYTKQTLMRIMLIVANRILEFVKFVSEPFRLSVRVFSVFRG